MPRFFNTDGQDASRVKVFDGGKPAPQPLAFRDGADPDSTGDAGLDFRDGNGRNEEPFVVPAHPCHEHARIDRTFGRRIGRHDVGVEQIQGQTALSRKDRAGLRDRSGMSPGLPGNASNSSAKLGTLDTRFPFLEGDEHGFSAAVARDDGGLAGHGPINHGREGRLRVLELDFLYRADSPVTTGSHIFF